MPWLKTVLHKPIKLTHSPLLLSVQIPSPEEVCLRAYFKTTLNANSLPLINCRSYENLKSLFIFPFLLILVVGIDSSCMEKKIVISVIFSSYKIPHITDDQYKILTSDTITGLTCKISMQEKIWLIYLILTNHIQQN